MRLLLRPDNFITYYDDKMTVIASRSSEYVPEVVRIRRLTEHSTIQDIIQLLYYLRPWDIKKEGNWMGREWLRLVAMQSLCYSGLKNPEVQIFLDGVLAANASGWDKYDADFCREWGRMTDSSCLPDPDEDFLRCIREVLDCIRENRAPQQK